MIFLVRSNIEAPHRVNLRNREFDLPEEVAEDVSSISLFNARLHQVRTLLSFTKLVNTDHIVGHFELGKYFLESIHIISLLFRSHTEEIIGSLYIKNLRI